MFEIKRKPKYLSYSSVSLFEKDPEEFYIKYLASNRASRLPQMDYMAVGSAFDAYTKSTLHSSLFGHGSDPKFEFSAIFEEQVEPRNWDFGLRAGKHLWRSYVASGAYDDLLCMLQESVEPPQFETKVEGLIGGKVPFLGKPDCRFVLNLTGEALRVILDWKVKGYCSKHGASPSKGYALCRDGYAANKQSRSHEQEHKGYLAYTHRGLTINTVYMESCNVEYADQVTSYGWLQGEQVGDENVVVAIDEIVAKYVGGQPPLLRVANHRARVSKAHQTKLFQRLLDCWSAIESGHVFRDMTREESDSRCEVLEQMSIGLKTDGSSEESFFNECTRPQFKR